MALPVQKTTSILPVAQKSFYMKPSAAFEPWQKVPGATGELK
jgi:hypothetical protein